MSLYEEAAATFAELLNDPDFRSPAILTTSSEGVFDPVEGEFTTSQSATSVDCNAILAPITQKGAGGPITFSTMAILDAKPSVGSTLVVGPSSYTVKEVQTIAPNGVAFAWKALVE